MGKQESMGDWFQMAKDYAKAWLRIMPKQKRS